MWAPDDLYAFLKIGLWRYMLAGLLQFEKIFIALKKNMYKT